MLVMWGFNNFNIYNPRLSHKDTHAHNNKPACSLFPSWDLDCGLVASQLWMGRRFRFGAVPLEGMLLARS